MTQYTKEEFDAAIQDARCINQSIEPAVDGKPVGTILMAMLMHIGVLVALADDETERRVLHRLVAVYLDTLLAGIGKLGPAAQRHPVAAATACLHGSIRSLLVGETVQ